MPTLPSNEVHILSRCQEVSWRAPGNCCAVDAVATSKMPTQWADARVGAMLRTMGEVIGVSSWTGAGFDAQSADYDVRHPWGASASGIPSSTIVLVSIWTLIRGQNLVNAIAKCDPPIDRVSERRIRA